MDYSRLAAEWVRVLRGRRSQIALSRRLGYRSNALYRWEAGHCAPTAVGFFELLQRVGGEVEDSLLRFYRSRPAWMDEVPAVSAEGVARLLDDLRGRISVTDLAKQTGFSRFQLTRWMRGQSQLSLPEFLAVVDAATCRLLDFVACFTDPSQLPSVRADWEKLVQARELAYSAPWSHALLKVLSLAAYTGAPHGVPWIAQQVGLDVESVERHLELLEDTGQIHWDGERYRESAPDAVDTRSDPERARQLKAWWAKVALERLGAGRPGLFAYNLSAISRKDLQRLQELQRHMYREMARIIAESKPAECVVLYNAQLLALDAPADAVGAAGPVAGPLPTESRRP